MSAPSNKAAVGLGRGVRVGREQNFLLEFSQGIQVLETLVCSAARKRRFLRYQSYLLTDVHEFIIYFSSCE